MGPRIRGHRRGNRLMEREMVAVPWQKQRQKRSQRRYREYSRWKLQLNEWNKRESRARETRGTEKSREKAWQRSVEGGKGQWKSSSTKYDQPGSPALHHARAYIIKHRMKYSLLLPLDAGFIFVEGKSPMRKSALSKTPGLSERWGNATDTVWRGVYGWRGKKGVRWDKHREQEGVCLVMWVGVELS